MNAHFKNGNGKIVCIFKIQSMKADRLKLLEAFKQYPEAQMMSYKRYDYTASDVYASRKGTLR